MSTLSYMEEHPEGEQIKQQKWLSLGRGKVRGGMGADLLRRPPEFELRPGGPAQARLPAQAHKQERAAPLRSHCAALMTVGFIHLTEAPFPLLGGPS